METLGARDLGELGLTKAVERVVNEASGDSKRLVLAVCEALFWIEALDDWRLHDALFEGQKKWGPVRNQWPDGELVGGLIFARNCTAHGLTLGVDLLDKVVTEGPDKVLTEGGQLLTEGIPVWIEGLSARDEDRAGECGKAMYDAHVAGRPIPDPLVKALAHFAARHEDTRSPT